MKGIATFLVGITVIAACTVESTPAQTERGCDDDEVYLCQCASSGYGGQTCLNGKKQACECLPQQPSGSSGTVIVASDSGVDGCVPSLVYVDADGDGFGTSGAISVCVPSSSGYSPQAGDCDDLDARAFPGQPLFIPGTTKGSNNGDFNCDGKTEFESGQATNYCVGSSGCGEKNAWAASKPAACGESVLFVTSCTQGGAAGCQRRTEMRTQACR